jgi:hypothetical protein
MEIEARYAVILKTFDPFLCLLFCENQDLPPLTHRITDTVWKTLSHFKPQYKRR